MSYADKVFIDMCNNILNYGTSTVGEKVRPHWKDGSKAYTIKLFGVCNSYNLMLEFPALTLRPTALKSAMDEILWIWQKKSNNIHDLNSHIWDSWADETGSIGKSYGYQLSVRHPYKDITLEGLHNAFPYGKLIDDKFMNEDLLGYQEYAVKSNDVWYMDQVNRVIYDLKNTPFSRRIMTNMYTFSDLNEMALYPCAYSMTFNVTEHAQSGKLILNAILNQRSNDVLTANNWNVSQYAILLMMIAQVCDMIPGKLVHMIADAHIYDKHIPLVQDLITRKPYPSPKVRLNPDIDDFYKFSVSDLLIEDYKTHPQIKNIPVAI